jgi:hypothetical protein
MKMKLNGWQRLWVVLSALYLAIVIVFTWSSWPTRRQIDNSWVYDLINATKDPKDYAYEIRDAYKDIPDGELIQRINAKYSEKSEYKEILKTTNLKYQMEIESLGKDRFKTGGIALLAWLIPIGLIYLLGVAAGWIYKGFKGK